MVDGSYDNAELLRNGGKPTSNGIIPSPIVIVMEEGGFNRVSQSLQTRPFWCGQAAVWCATHGRPRKKTARHCLHITQFRPLLVIQLTTGWYPFIALSCLYFQVLEVCYNRLSSLQELDRKSHDHLQHLGVSYNQIGDLQFTPRNW